jgi:hypothetical protein
VGRIGSREPIMISYTTTQGENNGLRIQLTTGLL